MNAPLGHLPHALRAASLLGLGALAALGLIACDDDAALVPDAAPPPLDAAAPPPVAPATLPDVYRDLADRADRAHLTRGGPVFGPGLPGWARVSTLAGRGPWAPPRTIDGRTASWLDGIGGSFNFPVGADSGDLRTVEVWLRPIARGQVVSIFLDEQPVTTTRLKTGWHRYRFPIPMETLEPGEHTLRFWFRFTRYHGKLRTPAAFGGARMLPAGDPPALPEGWSGTITPPGAEPADALYAGPPLRWSWYLLPPAGGRFFARAVVTDGEPVDFVVRLEADGEPPVEAGRVTVAAGTAADIDVPLDDFAGRPLRLGLETDGAPGAVERAAWLEPRILVPGRAIAQPSAARNLVLWVVDGLRDDRVDLGRGDLRAATPNLDMLAARGGAAVGVWSGGASAADGHRRLLHPDPDGPALATAMNAAGRRAGLLSASNALDPELQDPFNTRLDLIRAGEPAESRILLRELDAWLYVRKRDPFFLYIASADPRVPLSPPAGYRRLYDRARPLTSDIRRSERLADLRDLRIAYDAQVSVTDYWIGQLVALLHTHGVADDTAIIITGSVGQELREAGGLGDGHALVPEVFRVPLVVWHPDLRRATPHPPLEGGDLVDVGATALRLVGADPAPWPGRDLVTALFTDLPLAPRPSGARLGNQIAARFGRWLLRGTNARDLHLYDLTDPERERTDDSPIALRTLRDSMLDHP